MRKVLSLLFILSLVFCARAQQVEWLTDYYAAIERAQKENKVVMLHFTGSDWFTQGRDMREQIFNTPEFMEFAQLNLVLLEVDFPQKMTHGQKGKNAPLAERFGLGILLQRDRLQKYIHPLTPMMVDGSPTVFFISKNGKKLGARGVLIPSS